MKFSIITLFPNFLKEFTKHSIIKRAITNKIIEIEIVDLRKFGIGKHRQVDDFQYGGGPGMVLKAPVILDAIKSVKTNQSKVIILTPQGNCWNQEIAKKYSKKESHLILICGHYEGFDERIFKYVDYEVSIGDFVLTGGEVPAMIIAESIIRLIPNVISFDSIEQESFQNNLLDYPLYTKPLNFNDDVVPKILLSGHHKKIHEWRSKKALEKTLLKRPDLLKKNRKT